VSNRWDGEMFFKYWTDASNGFDIKFQDGPTGITWSFGKMSVVPQDPNNFKLPDADCSGSCSFFGISKDEEVNQHDFFLSAAYAYYKA